MASCKKTHKTGKYTAIFLIVTAFILISLCGCGEEPSATEGPPPTTETSAVFSTQISETDETTEADTTCQASAEDVFTVTTQTETVPVHITETLVEINTAPIPFATEYVTSDDMYEDETKIVRYGKDGVLKIKTTVTLTDGREIRRDVETEKCEEPEPEIIYVGTRPVYSTVRLTEKKSIGRSVEYVYDGGLYEDERKVTKGSDGIVTSVYLVRFGRGEEISRELIDNSVILPADDVIIIGTRPVFSYETERRTENVTPFVTEYVSDATMPEGETKIARDGSDGYETNVYRITFERGIKIGEELVSSDVTDAVSRVILIGTKKKEETFRMPFLTAAEGGADYAVTQYFGGSNSHGGIDFGVYYGEKVLAAMSGKVVYAYDAGYFDTSNILWTYGTYVVIEHENGYRTYYAHLSSRAVSVGDEVKQGQTVGRSGNTGRVSPAPTPQNRYAGTHLHFEMRKMISGSYVKVDPKEYLPRWKKQ